MPEPQSSEAQGSAHWSAPLSSWLKELDTDGRGLSRGEATRRLRRVGPNRVAVGQARSVRRELLALLGNPLLLVLGLAAAISAGTGNWLDATIIAVTVGVSLVLDGVQSHRSLRAAEALRRSVSLRAAVWRDAGWVELPVEELVPGDRIRLSAGDLVPADARVLLAANLLCDQATLTGESAPVVKAPADGLSPDTPLAEAANTLFAGSSVVAGSAEALVLRTGSCTELGRMALALRAPPPPTAFERGLGEFAALVLRLVAGLVAFVVLALGLVQHDPLEALLFAVALAVGMTPEFMPMILTITLARGAVRMAREGVIVKQLRAIENLGTMTVLCTDKTGTLTEGQVRVEASVDAGGAPDSLPLLLGIWGTRAASALHNPIEVALRGQPPPPTPEAWAGWQVQGEVPFAFGRRRASVGLRRGEAWRLVTRGAPEAVLPCCDTVSEGPCSRPLGPDERAALLRRVATWGEQGLRVLAVGWREGARPDKLTAEAECGLSLAGFLLLRDPPRPEASRAVAALAADGVRVVMLSGDQGEVAQHVAQAVGVPAGRCVLGPELEGTRDEALVAIVREASVFARLTPEQKTRVVEALRQAGEVVGYMGDGINDAPSLRRADVGLSVDSAVDVAREAASIILTRPDLGALHLGVLEGRRSFANVLKYVLMGTASNFGNMVSMAAAAVLLPFLPMLPVQVLLNNLLYDLGQVAIPADRVDREELAKPGRWSVPLIGRFMRQMGPLSSLFDLATFALLWGAFQARPELFRTGWFIESMWTQTLVIFVVRTRRRPLDSRPSVALVVGVVAVCLVAAALPYTVAGEALGFQPPPASVLLALGLLTALYLWCAEALKRRFFVKEEGAGGAAARPNSGNQRARRDSNARPPA